MSSIFKATKYKPNNKESVKECLTRLNQDAYFDEALLEIAHHIKDNTSNPEDNLNPGQLARTIRREINLIPITYTKTMTILGKALYKRSSPKNSWIKITSMPMELTNYIDTIYHEIAHLITSRYYRNSRGHDAQWMAVAIILGAIPLASMRHTDTLIEKAHQARTKPTARCNSCGYTYYRIRHRPGFWNVALCHKCDNTPLQVARWGKGGKIYWEKEVHND